MSNLQATVDQLANQFAQQLLTALKGMSIEEIAEVQAAPAYKPGRLRRAAAQITDMADAIEKLLKKGPMRSEEIRASLGVDKKVIAKPLADGVKNGRFKKRGEKRATTYSVAK